MIAFDDGGGFDNAGEGAWNDETSGPSPKRSKNKVQDWEHVVSIAGRTYVCEDDFDRGPFRLVCGKGRNEYGYFIEVGWCGPAYSYAHNMGMRVDIARRYLTDNDERVHWSLVTLKSQIVCGIPPIVIDEAWNHVLGYCDEVHYNDDEDILFGIEYAENEEASKRGMYPWRTLAFHSALWKQPVARNDDGILLKCSAFGLPPVLCGPPLPLLMPLTGEFRLQLDIRSADSEFCWCEDPQISYLPDFARSNTEWYGQCWGCGGPGVKDDFFCLVDERGSGESECYKMGNYCSRQCIRSAVPELARHSVEWRHNEFNSGSYLSCSLRSGRDRIFWDAMGTAEISQMEAAGWFKTFSHEEAPGWALVAYEASDYDSYGSNSSADY
jgi:hypothetical protein